MRLRSRESGNVVILILLAVGLFAALAYTFMRGSEQGHGNLTSNQAKIVAQEIISYSSQVDRTVQKLLQKGCSESQLSFEHSPFDGSDTAYDNPNSPSDFSCHVFHGDGGRLIEPAVPPGAGASATYIYMADNALSGIGTSNNDMIVMAYNIDPALCTYMNKYLWDYDGIPIDNGTTGNLPFKGDLSTNGAQILTASGDPSSGRTAACIRGGSNMAGIYFYYQVLIAR